MEEIKTCILSAVVKLAQTMLKRVGEFVENEKRDKEMFYTYIKGYRVLNKAGILLFSTLQKNIKSIISGKTSEKRKCVVPHIHFKKETTYQTQKKEEGIVIKMFKA